MNNISIFKDLFVLELANNHWGSLTRGMKIIDDFSSIVRKYNVKTAIKLQFRDVDSFIHPDFISSEDRYIKKTISTKLAYDDLAQMVQKIKSNGLISMSTPFDEYSVSLCKRLDLDVIKIASSDISDWLLINEISKLKKPVIISTGGASLEEIDKIVDFFNSHSIPLAINHCVSLYPTNQKDMDIAQILFLKRRYPKNVIGFSTHEYNSTLEISMAMAVAYGAETFERHIDIENKDRGVTPYCSLPMDIDRWLSAYCIAKEMVGNSETRRHISDSERGYLDALLRGVYLKRDLKKGDKVSKNDIYLAIPLQKGQISCNEFDESEILLDDLKKGQPLLISKVLSNYKSEDIVNVINKRGK